MTKNKKIIMWALILLVLAVLIYLFIKKVWPLIKPLPVNQSGPSISSGSQTVYNDNWPLKKGSRGNNVKQLQITLNNLDSVLPDLTVDGIFGVKTEEKLKKVSLNVYPVGLTQISKEQLIELETKLG